MNGMHNMYSDYGMLNQESHMSGYEQDGNMDSSTHPDMNSSMMGYGAGQTLDQMIAANNQEMMRRRQSYIPRQVSQPNLEPTRRASMMEFKSSNGGDLADFQFDPNPQHAALSNQVANMSVMPTKRLDPRKIRSREDLALDTRFSQVPSYDTGSMSAYPSSMIPDNMFNNMDSSNDYISQGVNMGIENDGMTSDLGHMSAHPAQQGLYTTSPVTAHFPAQYQPTPQDSGGGVSGISPANSQAAMHLGSEGHSTMSTPQRFLSKQQSQMRNPMLPSPLSMSAQNSMSSTMQSPAHALQASTLAQHQSGPAPRSRRPSMEIQSPYNNQSMNEMMMDPSNLPNQSFNPKWSNAYSTTGFDMLAILMRVATRRNPQINIGPVDLACAFVVCDVQKHDVPIVYCSDMFERLTGYSRHECLGRNCRFLQAPDGKVQSGLKRKYVDDKSVLYLKNQINKREEAQLSIINYRKGGQPFMNLLTMIPITWDTDEYKYYVGFQVDLVEQPNSVSGKNPDGTYEINYNRSALPAYRLPAPDPASALENMGGQTISPDEVSQVLSTIGNGETELSRRIWDKVLLENTDDVVHVLSLKGLFLYLSPACKTMLEYDPSELVGTALSSVCHPSDIVPVTRELKDSSNGSPVNVIYRIRRKHSGYTWFEAHGSLHTEQGKGRKCIILVGRQRPVYALNSNDITISEGAGDAELWTKMSTTGMFLYVSSTTRAMLDRLPEDLVGTSMQQLMRPESRKEFGRVLELARLGEKSTFKHELQNRRGQVLQAQTTIYPGDAKKGSKPTFLLAQTRLLKMTRAMLMNQKSTGSVPRSELSMGTDAPLSKSGTSQAVPVSSEPQQSGMIHSTGQDALVGSSGILTEAGSGGVPIGSQDDALASEDNIFDELKTTRSTSWQFELRQMERQNRLLAEDLQTLLSRRKKRKRRKGMGNLEKDCANCHTRVTPEWRRGPSGQRDLCNSCGLRWAKQNGRVSPRKSGQSDKSSTSPRHTAQQVQPSGGLSSKEHSVETKRSSAESASLPPPDNNRSLTTDAGTPQMKHEDSQETQFGQVPPTIEEGQEPPHTNVLPA